jgi:hypothetical protein
MLILKALSLEPMHGFGISRRIEQVSRGVFKVNPGSLLTLFSGSNAPDGSIPNGVTLKTPGAQSSTRLRAQAASNSRLKPPIGCDAQARSRDF